MNKLSRLYIHKMKSIKSVCSFSSRLYYYVSRRLSFSSSSTSSSSSPIGIVLMNMGGPSSLTGKVDGVEPFLTRLFTDNEIIGLPKLLQPYLGPLIAKRRSPRIIEQYKTIGGKSPIGDWTEKQGKELIRKLEAMSAANSGSVGTKFKFYTCFRYAPPLTHDCLQQMAEDGIERAVAFSQYPHFSCTTTGSSLNHLWRESIRLGLEKKFKWSLIDRWPTHPTFISAVARNVSIGLDRFPESERDKVIIVFSAHSVPMLTVNKGDQYVQEVSATVSAVMDSLRSSTSTSSSNINKPVKSPYSLAWQSKVGFLPWMGPPTSDVLKGLGKQGHRYILLVPIAFTSDHVETLYEIDVEYKKEAHEAGFIQFERAPSLNDCDLITSAQAEIVAEHLGITTSSGSATAFPNVCSPQYKLNCAGCVNPTCRSILNSESVKLRDSYSQEGCEAIKGSPWPKGEEVERLRGLKGTPSA